MVDAIADRMIHLYYHPESTQLSLYDFQNKIKPQVLQIKREGCHSLETRYLKECQSDEISEFHDQESPYIAMWDETAKNIVRIVYRKDYAVNHVIECHCIKYNCHFEDALAALRGNSDKKLVGSNEGPFLNILKDLCKYEPRTILVVGSDVDGCLSSFESIFPSADIVLLTAKAYQNDEPNHQPSEWNNSASMYYEIVNIPTSIEVDVLMEFSMAEITGMRTIDSKLENFDIVVDNVKVDVWGHELQAVKDSINTLKRAEILQVQVYFSFSDVDTYSFYDLHSFLDQIGFAMKDQGKISRDDNGELEAMTAFFVKKTSNLWNEECSLFPPRQEYSSYGKNQHD